MKVLTVVGARPQFVKAAAVSEALRARHTEVLVHTGQHYDREMSDLLFEQLGIPAPEYNLGIGSGTHAEQTAGALTGLETLITQEEPDAVLVYGDANSTLAATLAAAKLHIPVVHVEAGLRSFNRAMPEEINRIVADHLSTLLLTPTHTAVGNLEREGITSGVHWVGDVMYDCALRWLPAANARFDVLSERLGLASGAYLLATIHRAENTDHPDRLAAILEALVQSNRPVLLPAHPRLARLLERFPGLVGTNGNIKVIKPAGYLEMLAFEAHASRILTDSGGVQKEGYFTGTPVITLRSETEWVETVEAGWNQLAGADTAAILSALDGPEPERRPIPDFGDGRAAQRVVDLIGELGSS